MLVDCSCGNYPLAALAGYGSTFDADPRCSGCLVRITDSPNVVASYLDYRGEICRWLVRIFREPCEWSSQLVCEVGNFRIFEIMGVSWALQPKPRFGRSWLADVRAKG